MNQNLWVGGGKRQNLESEISHLKSTEGENAGNNYPTGMLPRSPEPTKEKKRELKEKKLFGERAYNKKILLKDGFETTGEN